MKREAREAREARAEWVERVLEAERARTSGQLLEPEPEQMREPEWAQEPQPSGAGVCGELFRLSHIAWLF